MKPRIGTRVILTDTVDRSTATVANTPTSFWMPGTMIRSHGPGVVWVNFDDGGGAPWGIDRLEIVEGDAS